MAESLDMDIQDSPAHQFPAELSLQKPFHSFRQHLQSDFQLMITELKADIKSLIPRIEHVERKMAEFAKLHDALIDTNAALGEDVTCLSAKVLDLEDCSTCSNIRIQVSPDLLRPYLMDIMDITLLTCFPLDLTIDHIHRLPILCNLPQEITRDTIVHIRIFNVKDEILQTLRRSTDIPKNLTIYPHLSAVTMLKRKKCSPYTKIPKGSSNTIPLGLTCQVYCF